MPQPPLPLSSKQVRIGHDKRKDERINKNALITSAKQQYSGYLQVGDRLCPLPAGSTLDAVNGVFYWQPGPGFAGGYRLVFLAKAANGQMRRKTVTVEVGLIKN